MYLLSQAAAVVPKHYSKLSVTVIGNEFNSYTSSKDTSPELTMAAKLKLSSGIYKNSVKRNRKIVMKPSPFPCPSKTLLSINKTLNEKVEEDCDCDSDSDDSSFNE